MNKTQFFEYIFPVLNPILNAEGFEYKKTKGWVKGIHDGAVWIIIDFYKIKEVCNTNLFFVVNRYSVNKTVIQYIDNKTLKYKEYPTFLISLNKWLDYQDPAFSFIKIEGLDTIIDNYYKPFLEKNLGNYSKKYAELEKILEVYTNPLEENYKLLNRHYDDKIIPVVIAKLLNNDLFEKIAQQNKTQFEILKQKWPFSNEVRWYTMFYDKMINDLEKS